MGIGVCILFVLCLNLAKCSVLTPPYFNLAGGKNIDATATCGENGKELYCKLAGATAEKEKQVQLIQGQVRQK